MRYMYISFGLAIVLAGVFSRVLAGIPTECCICDDFSTDPAQRCDIQGICGKRNFFCPEYCETARKFVNKKWYTTRKCGQVATCVDHWYHTVTSLGCVDNTRGEPENGTTCYKCCKVTDVFHPHFCVDNPDNNFVTFPVTTQSTTPTTTPLAISSTKSPTTTSTEATTSISQPSTTAATCETCTNDNCTSPVLTTCGRGEHYCMNTIIQHGNGSSTLKKACASKLECYYDAYVAMKENRDCGTFSNKAACHYCCQSRPGETTPCNKDPIPKIVVNFDNSQASNGTVCEVGRDGRYNTTVCGAAAPLCMNTVVLQTNLTVIRKSCESEVLCDQDWWNLTRGRPGCMKTDFSSLPVLDQGLVCHYCCKSSNGSACNTKVIPDDVTAIITRVDGGWSAWSLWQGCTSDCKGIRVRIRTCSNPFPSPNERFCVGSPSETETCGTTNCHVAGSGTETLVG